MDLSDPLLARRILEAAPVIALVLDTQGRIEFINPFGERLLGVSLDALRGLDWFDALLPPDERAVVRARFSARVTGNSGSSTINAVLTRSGERRWIDWASRRLERPDGSISGVLAIGNDVTERRAAEAALREREQGYRELFDANPHPMWVYDRSTLRFLAVNDAALARYGYSREQFLAMTIADIRPAEDLQRLNDKLRQALAGYEQAGVWRHRFRDGRLASVEISAHDLAFEGRAARLVLANDITARLAVERDSQALMLQIHQAHADAVAAGALLRDVLSRVDDGFVALDLDWRYSYVNQRAARLMGQEGPEHLLRRRIWDDDAASLSPGLRPACEEALRTQQAVVLEQHHPLWGRWYESRIYPSTNGLSVYFTDVTLRKQADAALAQQRELLEQRVQERTVELVAARDEAERANRAKSQFLSRMSHELRTPMNAILGFGQLMGMDRSVADKHRKYVQEMLRAGRHLLALINEVLDLARIESGQLSLSPEPLVLTDLVGECLRMTAPMAEARGVQFDVYGLDGQVLRADRTRLRQVLLNLLTNAVKYNHPQGRVLVEAAALPGDWVRLAITDTGPGIAADRLHELFQPFQRLGAEFSEVEGSGIGMTIARQLVELMGGRIGVDGRPGAGARFWIELPAAHLADSPSPRAAAQLVDLPSAAPLAPLSVLYVEDNPANLRLVQLIVERHPRIRMLSAMSARPALALARREQPDLILLDIHLPDIDGFALLAQLQADPTTRPIPVIALTAHAMPDDERRARAAGFRDFLAKPLDVDRLDAVLDALGRPTKPA